MKVRKIPGTNIPITIAIPAAIYGIRFKLKFIRDLKVEFPALGEDLDIIYATKGRNIYNGTMLPAYGRVIDIFNKEVVKDSSEFLNILYKYRWKLRIYARKFEIEKASYFNFYDELIFYKHKTIRKPKNENIRVTLKGASRKVKSILLANSNDNYPSGKDMAHNFTKSMSDWLNNGFSVSSEAMVAERLAICKDCDKWDAEALGRTGRCTLCGCSTKFKLMVQTESCPINKW